MSSTSTTPSPRDFTINCTTLLSELPVLERAQAARDAGFERVEFWWPFDSATPTQQEIDDFVASIEAAGVQLVGLNFFAGDMPGGDRGIVSSPGREEEFAANVEVVAALGERLGCRAFNALYGLRIEGQDPAAQDETAVANLALAARAVAAFGGTVLLEPVSGADAYPLKTAAEALAIIDRVRAEGVENIALLADFYHLAVNGEDVAAVIEAHAAEFGHIQIADSPGRGAPGTGDLPLDQWIQRSRALGYEGGVALEYKQDRATAFDWFSQPAAATS
ncbi:hydroxypyruvate isomerase [Brachybacterium vulturis]|uniref:Hydroxypyruvate isomerase n=1 Tax=Brachybacterium vulturis TaxID=2017484 RepID=A0A291GQV8_9MICO|nr:TIM barrel protein [Brachybacterium vulturis]ATG52749.1 hydroxypyruvate isomerase [Brachybacterium vulturis]